jgi:hypothetical protein
MIETHIAIGSFIFGIGLGFMLCFFGVPFAVNASRRRQMKRVQAVVDAAKAEAA